MLTTGEFTLFTLNCLPNFDGVIPNDDRKVAYRLGVITGQSSLQSHSCYWTSIYRKACYVLYQTMTVSDDLDVREWPWKATSATASLQGPVT